MDDINIGSRICLGGEGLGLYHGKAITVSINNIFVNIKTEGMRSRSFYFEKEIDAVVNSFLVSGYVVSVPR